MYKRQFLLLPRPDAVALEVQHGNALLVHKPAIHHALEKDLLPLQPGHPLHMNGQEVYKFAVSRATEDIRALCAEQGLELCRIGHFILHQANLRILEAVRTRLKQPPEKFPHNVEKYGNTSSAGIAILLDELNRNGTLENGEYLAMSAFGAGLTSGACILKWDLQG